mmetsp:Transcript_34827/g.88257  ORF Transcript_34827/g.88257 Transcript_34827/m.88257 type:complete len:514 (+) Transcript_34827:529-2070(+)
MTASSPPSRKQATCPWRILPHQQLTNKGGAYRDYVLPVFVILASGQRSLRPCQPSTSTADHLRRRTGVRGQHHPAYTINTDHHLAAGSWPRLDILRTRLHLLAAASLLPLFPLRLLACLAHRLLLLRGCGRGRQRDRRGVAVRDERGAHGRRRQDGQHHGHQDKADQHREQDGAKDELEEGADDNRLGERHGDRAQQCGHAAEEHGGPGVGQRHQHAAVAGTVCGHRHELLGGVHAVVDRQPCGHDHVDDRHLVEADLQGPQLSKEVQPHQAHRGREQQRGHGVHEHERGDHKHANERQDEVDHGLLGQQPVALVEDVRAAVDEGRVGAAVALHAAKVRVVQRLLQVAHLVHQLVLVPVVVRLGDLHDRHAGGEHAAALHDDRGAGALLRLPLRQQRVEAGCGHAAGDGAREDDASQVAHHAPHVRVVAVVGRLRHRLAPALRPQREGDEPVAQERRRGGVEHLVVQHGGQAGEHLVLHLGLRYVDVTEVQPHRLADLLLVRGLLYRVVVLQV